MAVGAILKAGQIVGLGCVLTLFGGTFTAPVKADPLFIDVQVNVWFGTASLYSPSSQFLSATNIVSVETNAPSIPQAAIDGLPAVGADVAAQILADPGIAAIGLPGFVLPTLLSFVDANGLGLQWDGSSPTAAEAAADVLLTTEPTPFVITADSGWDNFGDPFGYLFSSIQSLDSTTVSYNTTVNFFERDLSEQQVPEPSSLALLGLAILALLPCRRLTVRAQELRRSDAQ